MHFKVTAGSDFSFDFSFEFEESSSMAGAHVVSSIAREAGATPVLLKRNSLAGGGDAEIIALPSGNILSGSVYYTADDCRDLAGEYEWDIVAKTIDNLEIQMARGTIHFTPRVSRTVP